MTGETAAEIIRVVSIPLGGLAPFQDAGGRSGRWYLTMLRFQSPSGD